MIKPCVLLFSGLDPSGGAGIQADIQAISAVGAHPLPIVTALTVQDNDRVQAVYPVDAAVIQAQAAALFDKGIAIAAIKIGIVGQAENAAVIVEAIHRLRRLQPTLPVVLDTVLASGRGDLLGRGDAQQALALLMPLATVITPNLPEAVALCAGQTELLEQAAYLLKRVPHVFIKGGHGSGDEISNYWFHQGGHRVWKNIRLPGEFHGSGCTFASALAAQLAHTFEMEAALDQAQAYVEHSLAQAYAIADGQKIPNRWRASA